MIKFTATIQQFDKKGEKTGWSYIDVPADLADELKPGVKRSFKVKGKLDAFAINQVALIPMGDGNFIIPFNAAMRKGTGKKKGAMINVQLTEDKKEYQLNRDLVECLADEPAAWAFFNTKTRSFQNYYSKWIESAKTETTRAKRIALAVSSLAKKIEFGEMLRMEREAKRQ
ncbi:MAG TPA: YdeI/OmpD-associated family protein [Ferruginibacter sp.]|nr:YdeI/OmpD-associated family protein [Ferruginibacter sp.]HPH89929.1 YdeI/OmpD-associated family protein [Ferruginibacter sp.]